MLAIRIPTHPIFFPVVFIAITLGALFSAGTIIFFATVSIPVAIYQTLKEVYNRNAE